MLTTTNDTFKLQELSQNKSAEHVDLLQLSQHRLIPSWNNMKNTTLVEPSK